MLQASKKQLLPADIVHWSAQEILHYKNKTKCTLQLASRRTEDCLRKTCVGTSNGEHTWQRYNSYKIIHTCDDRLIISLRNQGTQVRDIIVKAARKPINVTSLGNTYITIKCNSQISKCTSCDRRNNQVFDIYLGTTKIQITRNDLQAFAKFTFAIGYNILYLLF